MALFPLSHIATIFFFLISLVLQHVHECNTNLSFWSHWGFLGLTSSFFSAAVNPSFWHWLFPCIEILEKISQILNIKNLNEAHTPSTCTVIAYNFRGWIISRVRERLQFMFVTDARYGVVFFRLKIQCSYPWGNYLNFFYCCSVCSCCGTFVGQKLFRELFPHIHCVPV